jgi:hypothetical protein
LKNVQILNKMFAKISTTCHNKKLFMYSQALNCDFFSIEKRNKGKFPHTTELTALPMSHSGSFFLRLITIGMYAGSFFSANCLVFIMLRAFVSMVRARRGKKSCFATFLLLAILERISLWPSEAQERQVWRR